MKTTITALGVVVCCMLMSPCAFAHQPSRIEANVNGTVLDICAYHTVSNPQDHYVEEIEVRLNGDKIIDQKYSMQSGDTQKAIYIIPSLKKGDEIEIRAHCNKKGEKKTQLTVR